MSHGIQGTRSPSNQSLVSIASSTYALDMPADSPLGPRFGSERQKQTLGDIIQQIGNKSKALLTTEDFTVSEPYSDLQFLAHQSRYNSDVHIKRRLIAKLVDSKVVNIFLRVFNSVHTVDYLGSEVADVGRPRSKSASEASREDRVDSRSSNSAIDGAAGAAEAPPVTDPPDVEPGSSQLSVASVSADAKECRS